jgi:GGDEF domain-containing protein
MRESAPASLHRADQLALVRGERRLVEHVRDAEDAVEWRADLVADHIQAEQRDREVYLDPLTGIANRRAAQLALQAASSTAEHELCVALFDIDHFKEVNDRLGHDAGDHVIVGVASVLAREARGTDFVARWGGEEFMAVLPGSATGAPRTASG